MSTSVDTTEPTPKRSAMSIVADDGADEANVLTAGASAVTHGRSLHGRLTH